MTAAIVTGNAEVDAAPFRSWLLGYFIPPELGLRSTEDIEVKWGKHASGEQRREWGSSAHATSLSLLVQGRMKIFFDDGSEALLERCGDYAMWAAGVGHRWEILQHETVILTVRWPSRRERV